MARSKASRTKALPKPLPFSLVSIAKRANKIIGIGYLPKPEETSEVASAWLTEPKTKV